MSQELKQQLGDAIAASDHAIAVVDALVEQYVRTVLSCPEGEIVIETPRNGRRFLVDKISRPDYAGSIYLSGPLVKRDGSLGLPNIGTYLDSPWFECCLSNRLPR